MTDRAIYTAEDVESITPADDTAIGDCRAIYIGADGNLVVKMTKSASAVTFTNVKAGTVLPIQPWSIQNTNTTTSNLVKLV